MKDDVLAGKARKFAWILVAAMSLGSGGIAVAQQSTVPPVNAQSSPEDAKQQADLAGALSSKNFRNVGVQVHNGIVTLSGTVDLYGYKDEAYQKIHRKAKNLAIRNEIQVVGNQEMTDAELQEKLAQKIAYDRVGYGTTMFNAVTVNVQNGVVTLGGNVYWPPDMQAAVADAEYYPGVKDVINNIQVDPVSPFDDQIRIAVARAIYAYPALNQYAIDPAKPIRITVINGHVTLSGVVDSKMDKEMAGIRANGVPNVFSVVNNLEVAGEPQQK